VRSTPLQSRCVHTLHASNPPRVNPAGVLALSLCMNNTIDSRAKRPQPPPIRARLIARARGPPPTPGRYERSKCGRVTPVNVPTPQLPARDCDAIGETPGRGGTDATRAARATEGHSRGRAATVEHIDGGWCTSGTHNVGSATSYAGLRPTPHTPGTNGTKVRARRKRLLRAAA